MRLTLLILPAALAAAACGQWPDGAKSGGEPGGPGVPARSDPGGPTPHAQTDRERGGDDPMKSGRSDHARTGDGQVGGPTMHPSAGSGPTLDVEAAAEAPALAASSSASPARPAAAPSPAAPSPAAPPPAAPSPAAPSPGAPAPAAPGGATGGAR